jgi:hypothetical protein
VEAAAQWLKLHNRYYFDMVINDKTLAGLPRNGVLPAVEAILWSRTRDPNVSTLDATTFADRKPRFPYFGSH